MSNAQVSLLLPLVRAEPHAAPLDFLDGTVRRLNAFCELLSRRADLPGSVVSGNAAQIAVFLCEELPAGVSALAQMTELVDGTLGVGDPRCAPLERLGRELNDCAKTARWLGRELIADQLHAPLDPWPGATKLARRLARNLALVDRFVLPLARRRLSLRERRLLGERLC